MKSQTLKFISLTTGAKDEDEELMSGIHGAKDLGMLCLTDAACATLDGKLLSRIRGPSLIDTLGGPNHCSFILVPKIRC